MWCDETILGNCHIMADIPAQPMHSQFSARYNKSEPLTDTFGSHFTFRLQ